ncbi:MAG: histidine kinase [Cellulomonas sp.]|nr:histidine kinase [Cellulomonas sp.]
MNETTTPGWPDDLAVVAPALSGGPQLWRAPLTAATWRAVSQTVLGWIWLTLAGIVTLALVPTAASLVLVFGVGLVLLAGWQLVAHGFAVVEAGRLSAQTGLRIEAAGRRRPSGPGGWPAVVALLGDRGAWAASLYAVLGMFTSMIAFAVVIVLFSGGLAGMVTVALGVFPDLLATRSAVIDLGLVVGGVLALWLGAVAAQGFSLLQVRLGRALLADGPRGLRAARRDQARAEAAQAEAEQRAAHLAQTRTQAVGAAEDDRRRIERDLHDGAQQRLVALGVELGTARRQAVVDPQVALAALDHAHLEVKETLAELRDLVRGIHPAVLTDRGLDAALSALAARSPVPVNVQVDDADALTVCGSSAQAAAYFVVAEALTNLAKHAGAARARVVVGCADGRLRVAVHDDGRGGARLVPGGGLDGLRARVAALDGSFDLVSPVGGPTVLTVEVPCAS